MPNPSLLQWSHRYYQLKKDAGIEDVQSRSTIYQLTKSMVGDENHKISVAICTRVAIVVCCRISTSRRQREVHHSFPRGDFWDQVDKTLDSIKSMPCRKDGGLSISSPFIFLQSLTHFQVTSRRYYLVTAEHTVLHQAPLPLRLPTQLWVKTSR
jgi:hypothetical protein